ncbi:Alpha-galactosidase [Hondaea fermentalgiana]|uniref:Alpha-galactosidase n=1 Tax=Hondaea fermentalgiana TaxID=2315210 RepID=A0A2R5G242_9STRA|nr:Alpha-galactosidase [Hondaea fermentalgiana]|eukprot:GBG23798.1 Alpha-galactosidase [Hondaea fermentalgiana]
MVCALRFVAVLASIAAASAATVDEYSKLTAKKCYNPNNKYIIGTAKEQAVEICLEECHANDDCMAVVENDAGKCAKFKFCDLMDASDDSFVWARDTFDSGDEDLIPHLSSTCKESPYSTSGRDKTVAECLELCRKDSKDCKFIRLNRVRKCSRFTKCTIKDATGKQKTSVLYEVTEASEPIDSDLPNLPATTFDSDLNKYIFKDSTCQGQDVLASSIVPSEAACHALEEDTAKAWTWTPSTGLCETFAKCDATTSSEDSYLFVDAVSKRPGRGWSSWNAFFREATEDLIMEQVDLVEEHFLSSGYDIIHTDGLCTFANMASDGVTALRTNMNGLDYTADSQLVEPTDCIVSGMTGPNGYVEKLHNKGFRVSWYTPGSLTSCANHNFRSKANYKALVVNDVKTYKSWGIDILKIDRCGLLPRTDKLNTELKVIKYWGQVIEEHFPALEVENCRFACNNIDGWINEAHPDAEVKVFDYTALGKLNFQGACPDAARFHRSYVDVRPWASRIKMAMKAFSMFQEETGPMFGWSYGDTLEVCNTDYDNNPYRIASGVQPSTAAGPLTRNLEFLMIGAWAIASQPLFVSTDISNCAEEVIDALTDSALLAVNGEWSGDSGKIVDIEDDVWTWKKVVETRDAKKTHVLLADMNLETVAGDAWDQAALVALHCGEAEADAKNSRPDPEDGLADRSSRVASRRVALHRLAFSLHRTVSRSHRIALHCIRINLASLPVRGARAGRKETLPASHAASSIAEFFTEMPAMKCYNPNDKYILRPATEQTVDECLNECYSDSECVAAVHNELGFCALYKYCDLQDGVQGGSVFARESFDGLSNLTSYLSSTCKRKQYARSGKGKTVAECLEYCYEDSANCKYIRLDQKSRCSRFTDCSVRDATRNQKTSVVYKVPEHEGSSTSDSTKTVLESFPDVTFDSERDLYIFKNTECSDKGDTLGHMLTNDESECFNLVNATAKAAVWQSKTGSCTLLSDCKTTESEKKTYLFVNAESKRPPRGWSSWNAFYRYASESLIMEQVDLLEEYGLQDAGFNIVHTDGQCTFASVDATNTFALRTNLEEGTSYTSTSDMFEPIGCITSGMTGPNNYVSQLHNRGFLVSWYTPGGTETCSELRFRDDDNFEDLVVRDVKMYKNWSIDILKIDACGTLPSGYKQDEQKLIEFWHDTIEDHFPELEVENCRYQCNNIKKKNNGGKLHKFNYKKLGQKNFDSFCSSVARYHRSFLDIRPWGSRILDAMKAFSMFQEETGPFSGWSYGDVLEICNYDYDTNTYRLMSGIKPELSPSPMTENLEYVILGTWVIASQPLFISTELNKCNASIIGLLTDPDFIAINGEWSGDSGKIYRIKNEVWYWKKVVETRTATKTHILVADMNLDEPNGAEWDEEDIKSSFCPDVDESNVITYCAIAFRGLPRIVAGILDTDGPSLLLLSLFSLPHSMSSHAIWHAMAIPIDMPSIDPKVFFSNERTYLHWLNMGVTIGSIGSALLGFSGMASASSDNNSFDALRLIGLIMLGLSIMFTINAMYQFRRRSILLRKLSGTGYEDSFGPVALSVVLVLSLGGIYATYITKGVAVHP